MWPHLPKRRALLQLGGASIASASLSLLLPSRAKAQDLSAIKLIVPFAAGGGTDTVARVVAQALARRLAGAAVVVDNRPGAGGAIGTLAVVQSAGDGQTLLLGSNGTMVLNPLLVPALRYKVDRDLAPIAGLASVPFLIATHPGFEAGDIKGLLEFARRKPLQVTFASPGNGTTNHLVGVLLGAMGQVTMTHVPYRGAAPAMNDVVGGQVSFLSGDLGTLLPMVRSGKLKPLAVTGRQRIDTLPELPTVAEALPGFEATGWFGLFAPMATPRSAIDKLAAATLASLKEPEVLQKLRDIGGLPMALDSEGLRRLIAAESAKWSQVILDHKISADS